MKNVHQYVHHCEKSSGQFNGVDGHSAFYS